MIDTIFTGLLWGSLAICAGALVCLAAMWWIERRD